MEAVLSEEEALLRDSVGAQVARLVPSTVHELDAFDDAEAWRRLAEGGLLGVGAGRVGGDGSTLDMTLVAAALARAAAPVPFVGGAVLAAGLLAAAGAPAATAKPVLAGDRRLAVGLAGDLCSLATRDDPGGAVAWDAAGAEAALVLDGADPPRLVAVPLGEAVAGADVTRRLRRCDAGAVAEVGDLGGPLDGEALVRWEGLALCALSADMVGVMDGALALGVAHVLGRVQFGVPVGTFQAVQHLLADQQVTLAGARSLVHHAAWSLDHRPLDEALLAARAANAYGSELGKELCEAVVQVHGGMGMTWECLAHVFLRRMLLDRRALGDERVQLRAIVRQRRSGERGG